MLALSFVCGFVCAIQEALSNLHYVVRQEVPSLFPDALNAMYANINTFLTAGERYCRSANVSLYENPVPSASSSGVVNDVAQC